MPRGTPADLVGQHFGSWTVVSRDGVTGKRHNQVMWLCDCACGNTGTISTSNLVSGRSTQCRPCSGRRENNPRWTAFRNPEGA